MWSGGAEVGFEPGGVLTVPHANGPPGFFDLTVQRQRSFISATSAARESSRCPDVLKRLSRSCASSIPLRSFTHIAPTGRTRGNEGTHLAHRRTNAMDCDLCLTTLLNFLYVSLVYQSLEGCQVSSFLPFVCLSFFRSVLEERSHLTTLFEQYILSLLLFLQECGFQRLPLLH